MTPIPNTHEDWEHCITVKCGIPLTADYVAARIAALEDPDDDHTRKFVRVWGEPHRVRTLDRFREAARRLDR
jgi:hypothetical protein